MREAAGSKWCGKCSFANKIALKDFNFDLPVPGRQFCQLLRQVSRQ